MKKHKLKIKTTEDNDVYLIENNYTYSLEIEYDNGMGCVEISLDDLREELFNTSSLTFQ